MHAYPIETILEEVEDEEKPKEEKDAVVEGKVKKGSANVAATDRKQKKPWRPTVRFPLLSCPYQFLPGYLF